jgi:DNA transformation protein
MPAPTAFVNFVIESFSPLGEIQVKSMMGGWCVYCGGAICALIADNEVFVKAAPADVPRFAARGLKAFQPLPDKPLVMQYYQAPPEIFEDRDALREWVLPAVAAGRQSKGKPRKKASKR